MRGQTFWIVLGAVMLTALLSVGLTLGVGTPLVLAPNSAPWWGIPLFTLGGALSGACIAGGFTLWNEAQKRREAKNEANEGLERGACMKFSQEAHDYFQKVHDTDKPVSDHQMMIAYAEVEFIAEPDVVKAAQQVVMAAGNFCEAKSKATTEDVFEDQDVDDALRWFHLKRTDMHNTFRVRYKRSQLARSKTPVDKPVQIAAWEAELYSGIPD